MEEMPKGDLQRKLMNVENAGAEDTSEETVGPRRIKMEDHFGKRLLADPPATSKTNRKKSLPSQEKSMWELWNSCAQPRVVRNFLR